MKDIDLIYRDKIIVAKPYEPFVEKITVKSSEINNYVHNGTRKAVKLSM